MPDSAAPPFSIGQRLFESAPCALLVTDVEGHYVSANDEFLKLTGQTPEGMFAPWKFADILTISGKVAFQTHLRPMLMREGSFHEIALTVRPREGGDRLVLVNAVLERTHKGAGFIRFAIFRAEQRRLYERELVALRAAEQTRSSWLRQVEAMADIGAWTLDVATSELSWSEQMFRLFGLPPGPPPPFEEAMTYFAGSSRAEVAATVGSAIAAGRPFQFDADMRTAAGEYRRVRSTGEPEWANGKLSRFVGILQDITSQHAAEQQLWKEAHVDPLSGLANRSWFKRRLVETLEEADHAGGDLALMLLDLDGFKEVNDTLGHQAGDEVIRAVADRIREALDPGAFIARLGGDEYAVIMPRPGPRQKVQAQAETLLSKVREAVQVQDGSAFVSVSVGVATYPQDAKTPETLLRCADMALYGVKRSGGGKAGFFGPALSNVFDFRRRSIEKVRQALTDGRLVPFFQPKVRIADRSVYGYEALARIRNHDGTISGPADFLPAFSDAESAYLIGEEMLNAVSGLIMQWRARGLEAGTISINASEFSFQRGDYAPRLLGQLKRMGLPAAAIEVEITETVFLGEGAGLVQAALEELHDAGVSISLDDFGTGYATLTHLRDFPVDNLKIDRSFVLGLEERPQNALIIRGIIDLAHNLGIHVVAEGIETEAQYGFLTLAGCDAGQGNLFGKPVPSDEAQLNLRPRAGGTAFKLTA